MEPVTGIKLPKVLDQILNQKCISHGQVIQAITNAYLEYKAAYKEPEHLQWFIKQIPKKLMELLRDEQIDSATGDELDKVAEHFKTKRSPNQTDVELRSAIKRGIGNASLVG